MARHGFAFGQSHRSVPIAPRLVKAGANDGHPSGPISHRIAAGSVNFSRSELSPVRRSPHSAQDTEFLDVLSNLQFIAVRALGLMKFYQKPTTFLPFSGSCYWLRLVVLCLQEDAELPKA